jgi:hypothetical protein
VLALGLYFALGALAFLPSQLAMVSVVATTAADSSNSSADTGQLTTFFHQAVIGLGWQFLAGVVIILLRNRIATTFVPVGHDEGSAPVRASELRAVGVFLIGVYLFATGVTEMLTHVGFDLVAMGVMTLAPGFVQALLGVLCVVWGVTGSVAGRVLARR